MASIGGFFKGLFGADQFGNMTDAEKEIEMQKYLAENQTKWNMEGLQNAGINPILAVNGGAHSASTAGQSGSPDISSSISGITSAVKAGATIAMAIATKNPGLLLGTHKPIKGFRK